MKLMIRYIKRHSVMFWISLGFLATESFAELLQPTIMSKIVNNGVANKDVTQILLYGLLMLSIAIVGALCAVGRNILASKTSQLVGKELRSDLYQKVWTLSLSGIDRHKPAMLITRITNDVTQVVSFVQGTMRILLKSPIICIGAIVLLIVQTPRQLPIILCVLILCGIFIACNMRLAYPRYRILQDKLDRLNRISREFLTSIRVVKAFSAEETEDQKFAASATELASAGIKASRILAIFGPLINGTVNFAIVALLWRQRSQNAAEIGNLMASVNYMTQIAFALGNFSNILNITVRAVASSRRIQEVLEDTGLDINQETLNETSSKNSLTNPSNRDSRLLNHKALEIDSTQCKSDQLPYNFFQMKQDQTQNDTIYMKPNSFSNDFIPLEKDRLPNGSLHFEHVHFTYADAAGEALTDISFSAQPGETIGMIGATGSGKSTLVNLIPRFYRVNAGHIFVGDQEISQIPTQTLRKSIAIVPQRATLFSGTIRYNLLFSNPNASTDEMREAARIACADSFVESLPDQYETQLGQGGVNLSGGQKQRLCIARALLAKPNLLILDDSTSALDAATEELVLSGLRSHTQQMTVLLISQRIFSVMSCDRVLCMDNGKLVGFGTHQELMQDCEVYRAIYDSQIGTPSPL
ncbi:MAG: ABC transporter ATP-binding protein/permease [Clostridium sp.]|jgi:ATP-binding cassette subfamily B protein|nr:ABC transporter ATP-binding protein/permease [Clostridium sp.]